MPCFHPVEAWYSADRTAAGKRRLVFSPNGGFGSPIKIPCGKCVGCLEIRAQEWASRITHELQFWEEACFLTLTYTEENLPRGGSLDPLALTGFFKRLRFALRGKRLRYYACGEYGDLLGRPHYHVILFGFDFRGDRKRVAERNGFSVYTSELLESLWKLGKCEIGTVTPGSAMYVARYVAQKGDSRAKGRHREFQRCSMGIGRPWLERYADDLHQDFVVQLSQDRSIKRKVPRYYDKLRDPTYVEGLKAARKARALKHSRDMSPRRLADREEVFKAKIRNAKSRE
jgi:hypothetical protein